MPGSRDQRINPLAAALIIVLAILIAVGLIYYFRCGEASVGVSTHVSTVVSADSHIGTVVQKR